MAGNIHEQTTIDEEPVILSDRIFVNGLWMSDSRFHVLLDKLGLKKYYLDE